MSEIYIPGMEMPEKCISCKLMRRCGENDLDYVCMPARIYVEDLTNACKPRPGYCPLVPVPDHGRLIDADALIDKIINYSKHIQKDILDCNKYDMCAELITQLALAPTVIPADKEDTKCLTKL